LGFSEAAGLGFSGAFFSAAAGLGFSDADDLGVVTGFSEVSGGGFSASGGFSALDFGEEEESLVA